MNSETTPKGPPHALRICDIIHTLEETREPQLARRLARCFSRLGELGYVEPDTWIEIAMALVDRIAVVEEEARLASSGSNADASDFHDLVEQREDEADGAMLAIERELGITPGHDDHEFWSRLLVRQVRP